MGLDDTFAESANPVLWIAVEQDVADVEPGLDPRAFKFLDVSIHFDGAEKEFVPDFFDGDHGLDFLGLRNELADLLLRAPPGIAVRGLRIYDGGKKRSFFRAAILY